MIARVTYRGRTMKRVQVEDVDPATSQDEILAIALAAAGETRSRLFGWRIEVSREERTADVRLDTD